MKVILLYVSSLDGKVTKWGEKDIHSWTSAEDASYFQKTLATNNLIVMGSNTFDAVQPKPTEGTLRIVLTRKPEAYKQFVVPGQLEFIHLSPTKLIEKLSREGYKQMLLVSGKTLTTTFIKEKLVDELWLTVEPKIFGTGDGIVLDEKLDIQLELITVEELNKKGTLLLKYKIIK